MNHSPLLAAALALAPVSSGAAQSPQATVHPVVLHWLGETATPLTTGVSWGVPWPKGAVTKDRLFSLSTSSGSVLPLQTWPLAY